MCISIGVQAQTEEGRVESTIETYLAGTSYNNIEQILKAFSEDATLYLERNGVQEIVGPQEYANWFQKSPGSFNGRLGKVLWVQVSGNAALAKAEIVLPKRSLRFEDLFILRKANEEWKIVSKTADASSSNRNGKRVLFVLSNTRTYGNSTLNAGNSYSEIVNAYNEFELAGYAVDFVSPHGGEVSVTYAQLSNDLQRAYFYDPDFNYALSHTLEPDKVDPKQYEAIHYIGGSSAIWEVPENKSIQRIAMDIYEEQGGILSSVCHGTAGIVNLKNSDGSYVVSGRDISGYPDSYENPKSPYFPLHPFKIQETIERRGGRFHFGEPNSSFVKVDGRIVTGQNYNSSAAVARAIIDLLEAEL